MFTDLDDLLALADKSLYEAKINGSGIESADSLIDITSERFAA
jgi:hypothetical protein